MTHDGWLKTGDMGYIGTRWGRELLYITGRYKNIIVTGGGKNVYPEEVEEFVNDHPYVLESIVVGVTSSDKDLSETPCALIVLDILKLEELGIESEDPKIKSDIDAHVRAVNSKLQTYQKIRGYEIRTEELHKNSTRKIKRFEYKGSYYRYLLKDSFIQNK
jgi:long-chain acyl-CoA synthetase